MCHDRRSDIIKPTIMSEQVESKRVRLFVGGFVFLTESRCSMAPGNLDRFMRPANEDRGVWIFCGLLARYAAAGLSSTSFSARPVSPHRA